MVLAQLLRPPTPPVLVSLSCTVFINSANKVSANAVRLQCACSKHPMGVIDMKTPYRVERALASERAVCSEYWPDSQFAPVKPGLQWHEYEAVSKSSVQVPSFLQGLLTHCSTTTHRYRQKTKHIYQIYISIIINIIQKQRHTLK